MDPDSVAWQEICHFCDCRDFPARETFISTRGPINQTLLPQLSQRKELPTSTK